VATLDEVCGVSGSRTWLCERVYDLTGSEYSDEIADAVGTIIKIGLIIIAAYVATRVVRIFIKRTVRKLENPKIRERLGKVKKRTGLSLLDSTQTGIPSARRIQRAETIGVVLRSVTATIIWVLAIVWILDTLGVSLGPVIATAGIAGVALGFGAQSLVRDYLAGAYIVLEDQYGVGDVVDLGDVLGSPGRSGTVELVTLRATHIRDVEGTMWHIPNGEIRRAGNMSQQWSRAVLDVEVARTQDLDVATEVIKRVADEMYADEIWRTVILDEPAVWGVEALAAQTVKIRLVVKTLPLEQWRVARELRARIKAAFESEGIETPPPVVAPPADTNR